MAKKLLGVITALALVGGVLSTATALAQEAPTAIPEVVQIDDPFGDANTQTGDQQFGEDLGSVGDLGKVWFTHDAETLTLNIQTETAPPASASNYRYNVYANPTEELTGTSSCLRFEIIPINDANPGTYFGEPVVKVIDRCAEEGVDFYAADTGVVGELAIEELADGTGLMKAKFPRSIPAFADGAAITKPFAIDYIGGGTDQLPHPQTGNTFGFTGLRMDDSVVGVDYTISGGGPVVEPPPVDPPKVDPPVKNGCKKGKGKKKGCKKPACPAFTPAEAGAEAPLTKVTDAATEEAPIEIPIAVESGTPVAGTHVFHNLQVDSKNKDAGLYVRYEFPTHEDLDLYLYNSDGSTAAQAAGFNPFPFIPNNPVFFTDGTGTGGHSEQGAEQVDGVLTPDCGGYTADMAQYLSEGGEMLLKVWLGPATWDPVAQAPIEGGE